MTETAAPEATEALSASFAAAQTECKVRPDGSKAWLCNGKIHREDGPALINSQGEQWFFHGQRHRENGPAVTLKDGTEKWYRNGEKHREDGPAIINANGNKKWYQRNKLHREDGPAVIKADGTVEWHLDGKPWPEGPEIVKARETAKAVAETVSVMRNGSQVAIRTLKKIRLRPTPSP